MHRSDEESGDKGTNPAPATVGRYITYLLFALLVGLAVAATGYFIVGTPLWLFVLPIALAGGWVIAGNNTFAATSLSQSRSDGPVLW